MNPPSALRRARDKVRGGINLLSPKQSRDRLVADAGTYWSDEESSDWSANSHWRAGLGDRSWDGVGRAHIEIFEMFARALGLPTNPEVVIEWGCGGGANAVAFAPRSKKFIAADVSRASVDECRREIAQACGTPTEGLVIDIRDPEASVVGRENTCDLFLCVYVLELTPGPAEALRIVGIAERLLTENGMALFQVKYHTESAWTRGRQRNYFRNLANTTTFAIDDFWTQAEARGLTPRLVTLVPKNELDERYAYFALTR